MISRFLLKFWRVGVITLVVALLAFAQGVLAQSGNQWRIDYYPNSAWSGAAAYTQYSNVINFNWGANSPGPNMPASNWTARLTSDVYFVAGTYRFTVVADDEFVLAVDGFNYYNTLGAGQSGKAFVIDVGIIQGMHRVQVDFRQYSGPGYLSVDWQYLKDNQPVPPPTGTPAPTPVPIPGKLVTRYGDYTPCMLQNLHQAECFQSDGQWDSPNLGSIQLEPKIVLWGNCKGDEIQNKALSPNTDPQLAKCSKTEAGWFPN